MTTTARVLFLLLLISGSIASQERTPKSTRGTWHFVDQATVPKPSADMPRHVRMLYSDKVDMRELERAFAHHYADRDADAPLEDLERDPYAKYFAQWYRGARDYVGDDGVVRAMTTLDLANYRAVAAQPQQVQAHPRGYWSFVGPKRTVWRADDIPSQPVAPWQVNIYCLAAARSNPNLLYCGSETGALYKSTNRGVDWKPFDRTNWGGAILSVAVDPENSDIVFAGTGTDIFRTVNGGATWSIVYTASGLSCNSIIVQEGSTGAVLAGTAKGLLQSLDGGANWATVLVGQFDDVEFRPGGAGAVYALVRIAGADQFLFYRSNGVGQVFLPSMSGWGTHYDHSGGRLCVSAANNQYIYAVLLTDDGSGGDPKPVIQKSINGGLSWTTVAVGNTAALGMNNGQGYYDLDIQASQLNAEHVIAATTTAYRSTDGGIQWTAVGGYTGPFNIHPDVQQIVSVLDGDTENTWIATDGGLNFSTDFYADPANWEPRIDGLDGTDFWGFAQGWNDDYLVGGRYHNGNTALHENYPQSVALRLGGAESVTGWALHGRERFAAFDDISELILPEAVDQPPAGSFLFTKHPQNFYYGDAFSRVMVDLEDFLTVYIGQGNSFWRSLDGGGSWEATHTFGGKPYHFDISRADGDYFYLASDDGFYRSTDRGISFEERVLPPGLTNWHSQNLRVAASSMNRDEVWVLNQRSAASSTDGRIFHSIDGGATWTDWTTPALAGRKWTAMAHQAGTNGGVYIASRRGEAGSNPALVMYRDNSLAEWANHSAGLPYSASPIKILPFYRDGKLRWGGNRGAWEIDFYEPNWTPIAQPFVSGKCQACVRNSVEFDSYSVAKADATYSWQIPGAETTTSLDSRQVTATFPTAGTYTATLTVTQDGVTDAASVEVTLVDECSPESVPGNAVQLDGGTSDYLASTAPLDLVTNELTLSAWIKRSGDQEPYAGVMFMRTSTSAGLNFTNDNELGFHWKNLQWWWNSGHVVPDEQWTHVAMVTEPGQTTLYLNGVPSVNTTDNEAFHLDGLLAIGADPGFNSRRFRGEMDEVAVYERALSQTEVRELMHLTRDPSADNSLVAYWQFNRATGIATDRVGTNHASLLGSVYRTPSTVAVGPGVSACRTVLGTGPHTFEGTGLELNFSSPLAGGPLGDICVTRLDLAPDQAPLGSLSPTYWIVHNYGANANFDELAQLTFQYDVSGLQALAPETFALHKRAPFAHGNTWNSQDTGDSATAGTPGSVTFSSGNGQTSFGQYLLTP